MAEIIKYPVFNTKIKKTDREKSVEFTICDLCDYIVDPVDLDEDILSDLLDSISEWFYIKERNKM